ncbi:IS5 family transposase [Xanthomonas albilineans]|uniref:IS5 family transposase n=1 Tax=Xanthomonas albilineans TaxID=29447 RepID=UPI0022A813FD|nr:IS5 family transposase [Xanthomonas albilineans]
MSGKQFEQVRLLLEEARKKMRPRTADLYKVFCAVLYVLKSGWPWRMLPESFPKWRTVHAYFQIWSEEDEEGVSPLERAFKKSGCRGSRETGAQRPQRVLVVDAQSVKNSDTARQKGDDTGKKVPGIKRHIAVDTQGLPHAVAVTTAEVTDRKGVLKAFARCKAGLGKVRSVLADSGYVGQPFALDIQAILGEHVTVQIAKRIRSRSCPSDGSSSSLAWLEKHRRLWKNYERKLNTSLQFVHLTLQASMLWRL